MVKLKSGTAFCTDEEGLKIDSVLSAELMRSGNKGLYKIIKDRYVYRMSKKAMAKELNENILNGACGLVRAGSTFGLILRNRCFTHQCVTCSAQIATDFT